MENIVNFLNGIIWAPPLVYTCLALGVYFTVRTKFVQIRHLKRCSGCSQGKLK